MKVSVCMAVYNGTQYLRGQIDSILSQLRAADELIAVDDCSQDRSVELLREIADPRLLVHRNPANVGVMKTFEKALRLASGDIIFLSDQDDVWLPGKVSAALAVYASRPDVTMVATDATVIDGKGKLQEASFFAQHGRFVSGPLRNFLRNKHLGCTLSFRREMLEVFLPIPPDVPMHDIWFGILNGIYGRTYFVDKSLVAYRHHERNLSPRVPFSAGLTKVVLWRYRLAKNIACRMMARARKSR